MKRKVPICMREHRNIPQINSNPVECFMNVDIGADYPISVTAIQEHFFPLLVQRPSYHHMEYQYQVPIFGIPLQIPPPDPPAPREHDFSCTTQPISIEAQSVVADRHVGRIGQDVELLLFVKGDAQT